MYESEIAIVGAGCRFPWAENLEEFWRVLVNGENHVRDIPDSRWNTSAFYDEDKSAPGKIYARKAGLLINHDKWDNKLFGISDVEASRIDPQQRYVLECVHMAMEDGGFTRKRISGSKTGVIIGCMNDDYKSIANSDLKDIGSYNATGTSISVISARVSYVYNLHGTCLTLDTACSSSLTAVYLAAQAIQTGDCDMVICGGVNSILTPDTFKAPCEARMMSETGQCQSFCDTADGYARGEGCGIVILKRLKEAIEDGNKVWATIRVGSNQDGCTTKPMTAPSGDQQFELFERVYETYQFNPSDIQYIEAHGTGTPRGDPTELNALGKFFSSFRNTTTMPLLVGSVKSNIGHTESAAGIAGLLKVLLMMKNGLYVPSLHVKSDKSNLNPKIRFTEVGLEISSHVRDWPCNVAMERHACLNSFGFGGSNTHVIISQQMKSTCTSKLKNIKRQFTPICLSGINQEAPRLNLLQFHDDIEISEFSPHDIASTSFNHRDIFPYRTIVFGKDTQDIQKECKNRLKRIDSVFPEQRHKKVFIYCGVGTTWTGMCRELMKEMDVFSSTINRIDEYLERLVGWKIGERFVNDTSYDDPFLNHIAFFCSQVALTEVWRSFGIEPDAVIGQSVGEVAAAYAAKFLTLEEAVELIYRRSKILCRQGKGSMVVIGNMDIKEVENSISKYGNDVCIAVYSSPVACTLSGDKSYLSLLTKSLQGDLEKGKVFVRQLRVKCAYHSPLLDCSDEIKDEIDLLFCGKNEERERRVTLPMISTVTGRPVAPDEIRRGSYWARNVCDPVLFMQSIKQIYDPEKFNIFLEVGPRPVLKPHVMNIVENYSSARVIPSLLANVELPCFYGSITELFELGVDINFSSMIPSRESLITQIPRYRFNRTGDLFIPTSTQDYLAGLSKAGDWDHMFVQCSKRCNNIKFVICIDEKSTPFVYDHFLFDNIIVPGATYVETGFHVGKELFKKPADQLSVGFIFTKTYTPLIGHQHKLNIEMTPRYNDSVKFNIRGDGNVLAVGTISERKIPLREPIDIEYLKAQCHMYMCKTDCYEALKSFHFRYGENLRLIQKAWVSESRSKCLTEIKVSDDVRDSFVTTHFHPTVIDSMFQIFGILSRNTSDDKKFAIPKGVNGSFYGNRIFWPKFFCNI